MSRRSGRRTAILAVALAALLALAGAAIAAGGKAPRLLSPNHKRVAPGHIRLVVAVPLRAARHGVFITIATKRKLDKSRHLKECSAKGCDFVGPTHWKGHGNKYTYVARYDFPGYWAVTAGKYYWQAHYYTAGDTAVYYSGIGSFVVK